MNLELDEFEEEVLQYWLEQLVLPYINQELKDGPTYTYIDANREVIMNIVIKLQNPPIITKSTNNVKKVVELDYSQNGIKNCTIKLN